MLLEFGERTPFFLKLVTTNCQLVGNFFGYAIQGLLAVCAFSALVVKKWTDKERRSWKHWARDTSKQAFGSAVVHFSNLAISYYLLDASEYTDPCVFYEVSFLLDAVVGTVLTILLVKLIEYFDYKYWKTNRLQSGFYGNPPLTSTWFIQTSVWVGITAAVKAILLWCVLKPFEGPLYAAGAWLMSPFALHPKWELVMVMIVIPLVMNALVFWNTDAWIMNSQHVPEYATIFEPADEFPCCRRTPTMNTPCAPDPPCNDPPQPELIPPNGLDSTSTAPIDVVITPAATDNGGTGGGGGGGSSGARSMLRGGGRSSGASSVPAYFFAPRVTPAQRIRSEDYHRL